MMCGRPRIANTTNHTVITGPKALPTRWVPCRWIANRPVRITTDTGRTNSSRAGLTTTRPSIADITEIAGVITLSP